MSVQINRFLTCIAENEPYTMKYPAIDIFFVVSTLKNPGEDAQLDVTGKVAIFVKKHLMILHTLKLPVND